MENNDEQKILQDAEAALNTLGDCSVVYELIKPLLTKNNPAALFLYSKFSIAGMETEDEFDIRRMELLNKSADSGYLPAVYELAVCFDLGDLVEQDHIIAGRLYKKAAEAGYAKAKLSHGLNLFYGSNGMNKDELQGMALIQTAALENVEEAKEFLNNR